MGKKVKIQRIKLKGLSDEQTISDLNRGDITFIYARTGRGKTLLGDLIAYGLGWKKKPIVREVQKFDDLYLEFTVDDETYVINRKLKQQTAAIHMDKCKLESFRANNNNKYSLSKSQDPKTDFSPHMLDILNIPIFASVPDKVSKSTKPSLISFRDIFQYVYLWQERIDSDTLFGLKDHWALNKAIDAFKVIFKINPPEVYSLDDERLRVSQNKEMLLDNIESIGEFLTTSGFNSLEDINYSINKKKKELEELFIQIKTIEEKQSIEKDKLTSNENYKRIIELRKEISKKNEEKIDSHNTLDKWNKLLNSYKKERKALFLVKKSDELIEDFEIKECPCCGNEVKKENTSHCFLCKSELEIPEEELDNQLQKKLYELDLKEKELFSAIQEIRNRISHLDSEIESLNFELNNASEEVNQKKQDLQPLFNKYRDLCISAGNAEAEIKNQLYSKGLYSRLGDMKNEANKLLEKEEILKKSLKEVMEKSNKRDKLVRETILKHLTELIEKLEISEAYKKDISIDNRYLPKIGGESYLSLSSGGFKVYYMTAYFISIIRTILTISDNHHPGLLIIDSIHKNISTTHPEDKKSVEILFRALVQIAEEDNMQIFVIDNELPEFVLKDYKDKILDLSDGLIK